MDIPIKVEDASGESICQITPWPLLLPKDLVQALFNAGYESALVGDEQSRTSFWANMSKDIENLQVDSSAVPLAIFGDEVTAFRRSCMCLHFHPTLSKHSTDSLSSRFLICILPADCYWIVPRQVIGIVFLFLLQIFGTSRATSTDC